MAKNCDLGLENAALGLRPRAAFSRPSVTVFHHTDLPAASNIYLLYDYMASSASGQDEPNRALWLATRAGRWSHLARSGLPAVSRMKNFPESHIINPLLTKFVRSRWSDIGLVLSLRVYGPSTSSRSINTQKRNLAYIQPSWPHTWSITHTYH